MYAMNAMYARAELRKRTVRIIIVDLLARLSRPSYEFCTAVAVLAAPLPPPMQMIDRALGSGDFHTLMEITKICDFETLLSNDINTSYEQCTEAADSVLTHAGVENKLLIEHAQLITQYEREIDDYPEHVCCSRECLYPRKSVTKVKLPDKLGNAVWPRLREFILGQCRNTNEVGTLYVCHYFISSLSGNQFTLENVVDCP